MAIPKKIDDDDLSPAFSIASYRCDLLGLNGRRVFTVNRRMDGTADNITVEGTDIEVPVNEETEVELAALIRVGRARRRWLIDGYWVPAGLSVEG